MEIVSKWFGPGSVLIVTTRDVHLLKLLKVAHVCTMKEMDEDESLELFSWHAFREPSPTKYLVNSLEMLLLIVEDCHLLLKSLDLTYMEGQKENGQVYCQN